MRSSVAPNKEPDMQTTEGIDRPLKNDLPAFLTPTVHVGLIDHYDPEVQAMMIAMYSRSYGPIAERLPTSAEEEASLKDRLKKFYVNYGHKSVGQLGTTTIFLEGVSQLAAKAIENSPLYNGQESSTRYIDFSHQPMVHFDHYFLRETQEKFRVLYVEAVGRVQDRLRDEFPFDSLDWGPSPDLTDEQWAKLWETRRTTYANTIKARAFDICRSLLPAGATTNVAFCGTFDLINDHFGEMLHHPSAEMRAIAMSVLAKLKDKYPEATPGEVKLGHRFNYVTPEYFYPKALHRLNSYEHDSMFEFSDYMNTRDTPFFETRKKYERFPTSISSQYRVRLGGNIDFGSFRDLHRHRNGVVLMPLLQPHSQFNQWYVDQLPDDIVERANAIMADVAGTYKTFEDVGEIDKYQLQYCLPMGLDVPVSYQCDLNQVLYLLELRTDKTVHQTLRQYMHKVWRGAAGFFPEEYEDPSKFGIYLNLDKDNFTLKRGTQTFSGEFGKPEQERPKTKIINAHPTPFNGSSGAFLGHVDRSTQASIDDKPA
jgi:thymidylate synthase ThyX